MPITCRNRHCPKYQGAAAKDWRAAREADLLPVGYFHLVFTLPAEIAPIAYQNKAVVYDLLFRTAAETLLTIAADPRHLGAISASLQCSTAGEAVLAYLARYTHRVAIANSRLVSLDERGVTFRYKDYRRNGRARFRTMTLKPNEFIRRFLLHVLPNGFHRSRPAVSEATSYTFDQAKIVPSIAVATTILALRSSIRRQLRRPAHPLPKPPPRQIPIDGNRPHDPPRVPSWEGFGRRPSAGADRSPRAAIRNPSP
jgi:hypothetical protein